MDSSALTNFIGAHFMLIVGTSLSLSLTVSMILLIRWIGSKDDGRAVTEATINVDVIEGAMKRVLSSQPVSVIAGATVSADGSPPVDGAGMDPAMAAGMQAAIQERDAKITALSEELEQLKSAAGGGDDPAKVALEEEVKAGKAKIEELQGRLTEYEIIEDDIADLSMYKDENSKMKAEIAKLKADLANRASAPAAEAAPAPAATALPEEAAPVAEAVAVAVADEPTAAPEPSLATAPAAELDLAALEPQAAPAALDDLLSTDAPAAVKFEKSEKFELDPNDDIMKEFAAAVQEQRAPPPPAASMVPAEPPAAGGDPTAAIETLLNADLSKADPVPRPQEAIDALFAVDDAKAAQPAATAENPLEATPDPEKMLTEVAALNTTAPDANAGDALEESLDTDKLLAEVDSLKGGAKPESTELDDELFKAFNKAQGS